MPLVTSSSTQGNLFRQADEPPDWKNGDIWVDTDNGILYVNESDEAKRYASFTEVISLG